MKNKQVLRKFFCVLSLIASFLLGFYVCLAGASYYSLQQSTIQTQRILESLFLVNETSNLALLESLNESLYWNIQEYTESKNALPSFISKDIDMIMCSNFQLTDAGKEDFKDLLVMNSLPQSLDRALEFCPHVNNWAQ